jgi:hypothetical protein
MHMCVHLPAYLLLQVKRHDSESDKKLLETPDLNKYVFCQVLADCGQVRGNCVCVCVGVWQVQADAHSVCRGPGRACHCVSGTWESVNEGSCSTSAFMGASFKRRRQACCWTLHTSVWT